MSKEKPNIPVVDTAETQVNDNRRRLTRAALAGPVVLGTLASKQALGGNIPYKCTISGQISGTASARPGDTVVCNTLGRSPGFWKNHHSCWGITGNGVNGNNSVGPYVYFSTIFGGSRDIPMGDIISAQCHVGSDLERAAVASYLNALHFHTLDPAYPLSTTQVVDLFNNDDGSGALKNYFESLYGDSDLWPAGYGSSTCPSDPHGYTCYSSSHP